MTKKEILRSRGAVCNPLNKELWELIEGVIPTPRSQEEVNQALISLTHVTSHVFMDAMSTHGSCPKKLVESYTKMLGSQLKHLLASPEEVEENVVRVDFTPEDAE